jgi:TRAP-type C4-dicarboxylate transport system substrate-binding protein
MVKKTGIRLLGLADNGVRHFTNSKRADPDPGRHEGPEDAHPALAGVQGPDRVAGRLRLRHPWGELPDGAAAEGTADGQENGVTNILAASLYQTPEIRHARRPRMVRLHAYMVNERFYQGR